MHFIYTFTYTLNYTFIDFMVDVTICKDGFCNVLLEL